MRTFLKTMFIVFTVILFALTVSLIAGCQSGAEKESFVSDELPMDRRIGTLKSLGGIKTESQGTHILELDNGDTILLKSLAVNLDDEKYYDETIEVRGILTYTKDSRSIMEVMSVDILEQYEADEAKKAKWITYSGDPGFSIKYRDDFDIQEDPDGVTFTIPDADGAQHTGSVDMEEGEEVVHLVMIEIDQKDEEENLFSYLGLEGDSSEDLLNAGMTKSKIGADSLDALKEQVGDGVGVTFYTEGGNYIYKISFEGGDDKTYLDAQNLFYEMLSTFVIDDEENIQDKDLSEDDDISDDGLIADDDVDIADDDEGIEDDDERIEDDDERIEDDDERIEDDDESEDTPEKETEAPVVEDGFSVFENETFEFSIQYPKNWYYSGSSSSDPDIIRRYEFGDEPIEDEPGNVYLDLVSGEIPSGSAKDADGKNVTVISSGGSVEVYIEGESRNYRLSGPSSLEGTLLDMAATLE